MHAHAQEWAGPGRRHQHHHHQHRGTPWDELVNFMRGPGGPFGGDPREFKALFFGPGHRGGGRGGRGGRGRPGDVLAAMLVLLDEQPQNGYQLIQEIERRSDGMWKPSPGSVYPALQQLEDEGLVRASETEGRRTYDLTPEGREYVEANREELGTPWAAMAGGMDEGVLDLRGLIAQVAGA